MTEATFDRHMLEALVCPMTQRALDYDPDVRTAREAEAMARLAPEIDAAREWVAAASARDALPEALGKPLVGEAVSLLG